MTRGQTEIGLAVEVEEESGQYRVGGEQREKSEQRRLKRKESGRTKETLVFKKLRKKGVSRKE